PRHSFVVHQQAPPAQLCCDPPIAVPAPMRDRDLLNGRPHVHIFLHGLVLLQCPIKSCPTHLGQLAHVLDPYPALPRHHRSDLGVDARAPDLPLCRRRASTLCKAPLKKSTSKTFSASTRFRWLISFRSVA